MKGSMFSLPKNNIGKLTYGAVLTSLCYIGALIEIQGSIAFDSMPAFFAGIFLGPGVGAMVGFIGHLLSATTSGFMLTIPMHIVIAFEMALFIYIFAWLYRNIHWLLASVVAVILNGPVAALIAIPTSIMLQLPLRGWDLFYFVIIPLTLVSLANISLAVFLDFALVKRFGNYKNV